MSVQVAKQFLENVAGDARLREELSRPGAAPNERLAAVVAAGRERGYEFTDQDVLEAARAAAAPGELKDDQLEHVAGGGKWYAFLYLGGTWTGDDGLGYGTGAGGGGTADPASKRPPWMRWPSCARTLASSSRAFSAWRWRSHRPA